VGVEDGSGYRGNAKADRSAEDVYTSYYGLLARDARGQESE